MRWQLPQPIAIKLNRAFAKAFGLDLREAERPVEQYSSIEELFTRRLKPGVRPIAEPICSPADGYLARSEPTVASDQAIQAKGFTYSLTELVLGPTVATKPLPKFAWYQTIYLAPHNYHRVHAPFSGRVTAIRYIPGELWPVNVPFVLRIPRLFCRNERLIFDFALDHGGQASVVMVGALNVGRMVTPLLPYLVTNALSRQLGATAMTHCFNDSEALAVAIGDEIGTFMLGSTVIIAYDQAALAGNQLVQTTQNQPILMGQSLLSDLWHREVTV